jgi:thiol-disulfide isomerase/thioredoxin
MKMRMMVIVTVWSALHAFGALGCSSTSVQAEPTTPAASPPSKPTPPAASSGMSAARPPLTVGSPAPKSDIATWIRGQAPDLSDASKTWIVLFWSPAITPARDSLPRLARVAQRNRDKGVEVVAIACEPVDVVAPLLDTPRFKDRVDITIGCDPDRSAWNDWMKPSWQTNVPACFIVHQGSIAWIGDPREASAVIEALQAGRWSKEGRRAMHEERAAALQRSASFAERTQIAIDRREWDTLLDICREMSADGNASIAREGRLLVISALVQAGRTEDSLRAADTILRYSTDWDTCAELATVLVSNLFEKPDLQRATMAALKAISLSKQREGLAYAALADVQLRGGQVTAARATLDRALSIIDPWDEEAVRARIDAMEASSAADRPRETPPNR